MATDRVQPGPLPAPLLAPQSVASEQDYRRYWAVGGGQSLAAIAKAESVEESEIEASLLRVRTDIEQFSATSASTLLRKMIFRRLEQVDAAVVEALGATKLEGRKVVLINEETGKVTRLEDTYERPDHDTRLRAMDSVTRMLAVVQPRDPAVQITSNSQTNILNQAPQLPSGAPGLGQGLASPEAVIRNVVAMRQLALAAPAAPVQTAPVLNQPATVEGEPAMARNREREVSEPDAPDDELDEELDDEFDEDGDEAEGAEDDAED